VPQVKWKIKAFLQAHNLTAYRLWKESGLAQRTVFTLARDEGERIDLKTFGQVLGTLERLTGKSLVTDDLLEVVRDA
jgi:hypothetical protein